MKTALTIAGSDSSGGAGIQADLKAFAANGVFGMSVLTAVTAQNTMGVTGVENVSPSMIGKQLEAIFSDMPVDCIKIGMVSNEHAIDMIAEKLKKYAFSPIVLDPVMVSKSGHALLEETAKTALMKHLFPLATLVTPNLPESSEITGKDVTSIEEMERAALFIKDMGPKAVLIKGGHLDGEPVDILYDGEDMMYLKGKRIVTRHTHGTGCTLSSAIAAHLAKGASLLEAVESAKQYVQKAIEEAPEIGHGSGPLHHFYHWYSKKEGDQHA